MPKMKSKSPLKTSGKTPQVTLFPRPPSPPQKKQKSNIKKRSKSATTPATEAKVFPTLDLTKLAKTETKKSKLHVAPVAPAKAVKKVKIVAEKKSAPAPPPKPLSPPKIDEQETSQMWILRHLRLHLEDINDSILANFVLQQDVTPFRNFMLDFNNERRCIFILVCRQNQQLSLPIPASLLFTDATTTPRSVEASEVMAPPDPIQKPISSDIKPASGTASGALQKPSPGKLMKPRAKSKKRTKSKEPKKASAEKENNDEKREEAKRQIIEEIVQSEISAIPNQDGILQLKWSNSRKIPDETDEFVFVVSREAERMEEKSELDQSYFVGYCKNSRSFKRLIEIGTLILGSKMTFERQMDMLLFANNALAGNSPSTREKWQNKIEKFENFICDSLGKAFWRQSSEINNNQSRADSILSLTEQQHSSVESIESLLRPRIIAFVKEAFQKS
uniref:Uncharacterized protein n=2 Tax=Panagrolaimus sp. PS1159 TaxID=55785 RepID=A0AC35FYB6_9BILA